MISVALLILAVLCWLLAALKTKVERMDLTSTGLFLYGLSILAARFLK